MAKLAVPWTNIYERLINLYLYLRFGKVLKK